MVGGPLPLPHHNICHTKKQKKTNKKQKTKNKKKINRFFFIILSREIF
jgi:hypothetical protein